MELAEVVERREKKGVRTLLNRGVESRFDFEDCYKKSMRTEKSMEADLKEKKAFLKGFPLGSLLKNLF